jgi:putative thioredoxin
MLTPLPNLYKKNITQSIMEINVTDETFEKEVIEKSKTTPVLADFWAEWCGPCKMLGPTLEKISKEHKGKLVVAKIETDKAPNTSAKYGIMSIPSVKLFKNGEIVDEFTGAQPEATIKQWLDQKL